LQLHCKIDCKLDERQLKTRFKVQPGNICKFMLINMFLYDNSRFHILAASHNPENNIPATSNYANHAS
jgi:hypothetical protein